MTKIWNILIVFSPSWCWP